MSAWITMPGDDNVDGHVDDHADKNLRDALDSARTPHGTVDNVMRVHGLRPATMRGHVALYRAALHDDANTLPMWLQETLGSYVSILNSCDYSLANHWANARHLINDDKRADEIEAALHGAQAGASFYRRRTRVINVWRKINVASGEDDTRRCGCIATRRL